MENKQSPWAKCCVGSVVVAVMCQLSGCAILQPTGNEATKACEAKGGQMLPTDGTYIWRGPGDLAHIYDYECSVK